MVVASPSFGTVECTLTIVSTPPFTSLGQALAFYNECNPARQRSINLLEPEKRGASVHSDWDPQDAWATIALGIAYVLNRTNGTKRWIWAMNNLGDRTRHKAPEEIAQQLGLKTETICRYLGEINKQLRKEFASRGLLADAQ